MSVEVSLFDLDAYLRNWFNPFVQQRINPIMRMRLHRLHSLQISA